MPSDHPKIEIPLQNGDVLIVPTTRRDPEVDEAFQATLERVRATTRERFEAFRRAQQHAA